MIKISQISGYIELTVSYTSERPKPMIHSAQKRPSKVYEIKPIKYLLLIVRKPEKLR